MPSYTLEVSRLWSHSGGDRLLFDEARAEDLANDGLAVALLAVGGRDHGPLLRRFGGPGRFRLLHGLGFLDARLLDARGWLRLRLRVGDDRGRPRRAGCRFRFDVRLSGLGGLEGGGERSLGLDLGDELHPDAQHVEDRLLE